MLVHFVDEVALVESAVHDEVLSAVVGDHDHTSPQICLDVVELEKAEQVVGKAEQDDADEDEVEG